MIDLNTSSLILIFNFFLYVITSVICYKKRNHFSLGSLIFMLYSFVTLVSFFLFIDPNSYFYFENISLFPFLYLYTLILITSYPLLKLEERKINIIIVPKISIIVPFTVFIILVNLLSVVEIVNSFDKILLSIFIDSSNAKDLYNESREVIDSEGVNYIAVFSSAFRDFPQFLLFYFLALKEKNRFIIFGLLISVLVSLLSGLVNGLRGNVIFVLLSSVFLYFMFYRFYTDKIKKLVRFVCLTIFLIVSIPFAIISFGRFDTGYSNYDDSNYALKSYSGQSFLYFNNYGLDANGIRNGDRIVNLFKSMVYDDVPKNWEIRRIKYNHMIINDEVFTTFIGDVALDFGPILTFLIFIVMSVFISFKTKIREKAFLHQILILYFLWNTITYGIFLFPYADVSGNLRIILFAILFIIFKISSNSRQFIISKDSIL